MHKVKITKGSIGGEKDVYRAELVEDHLPVFEINGQVRVAKGFGLTAVDALKDFIQRNHDNVLNYVYQEKGNGETKENSLQG